MATRKVNLVSYGQNQPLIGIFPPPIVTTRNPTANDMADIGQIWINESANTAFVLTSIVANVATWQEFAFNGGAVFNNLTVTNAFTVTNGPAHINSTVNVANAILLNANGGAAETIVIESQQGTTATAINIDAVAGGVALNAGMGMTLQSADAMSLTTSGAAQNINLTTLGAGSDIQLTAGGNITAIGDTQITLETNVATPGNIALIGGTVAAAGAAATLNAYIGTAILSTLVTPSMATETITITNAVVTGVNSGIIVTAENLGGNDAKMTVVRVIPAAGSFQVILLNNGAAALNGNLLINWIVINA